MRVLAKKSGKIPGSKFINPCQIRAKKILDFQNAHVFFCAFCKKIEATEDIESMVLTTDYTDFFTTEDTKKIRHGLTLFVSTSPPMSRSPLCSKQRLCSKRAFVPAGLLCPRAEKSAFVETKHGYIIKSPFLVDSR